MQIVKPLAPSRPVKFFDLPRVLLDSLKIKWAMLFPFPGRFPFAASISHCQTTHDDPLRFFVLDREGGVHKNGSRLKKAQKISHYFGFPWARTIINPKIVWHGNKVLSMDEGCMSIDEKKRKIRRWEIVEAEYWTFFGKRKRKFWLFRAALLQHELDHHDGNDMTEVYRHREIESSYERP